jgi:hypothetical protein
LNDVAAYFDRNAATTAMLLARPRERMQRDQKQKRDIDQLIKKV